MKLTPPTPTPFDPLDWKQRSLVERGRMVCEAWAIQGYAAPLMIYAVYVLKVAAYIGGWLAFCALSPTLGGLSTFSQWGLEPLAFQKAILWSMLFEGLGLGCGSGPLTGRYIPPIGGFLYFLRPGTTKLPIFPTLPLFGGARRTWFDVALYAALVAALLRALVAKDITGEMLWPVVVLTPLLGLSDRTCFLAFRSEHYWTTAVCFAFAGNWIAGAKSVQLALWFWAGVSKLNHHFPAVVCVMISNSPVLRFEWFRKRMYRRYPDDLRPSRLAEWMAHAGTALELGVPIILALSPGGSTLVLGIILMLALHGFITSNVPLGVPIEWNVMVVYGALALFWAHPEVSPLDVGSVPVSVFLFAMLAFVPLLGNVAPNRVSFLLAMRYYAGNWATNIWLFRGESYRKLERLTKSTPWMLDQLASLYDRSSAIGMGSRVMAFRLMHLHGRAITELIPRAVDRFEDYEYVDGEVIAGMVLGWNFGDGHLHHERLIENIQAQCQFEAGELRCVCIEGQPLGKSTLAYRIVDAHAGVLERGELDASALRRRQPWESAETAGSAIVAAPLSATVRSRA